MTSHMHIENTLGGIALGADGSSWPTTGPGVLDAITRLGVSITLEAATEEEWKTFLKSLRYILTTMAGGIMEAQASMQCNFMAASPYIEHVDAYMLQAIAIIKSKTEVDADPAVLRQHFENAATIHQFIANAYRAALVGEPIGQQTLAEQIISAFPEPGSPL